MFNVRDRTLEFQHLSTDLPLPTTLPSAMTGARSIELDTGKVYEYQVGKTGAGVWYQVDQLQGASGAAAMGTVALTSVGFDVITSITRPANVTAYTALDVVGGALDLGVLGPSAKPVQLLTTQLEIDIAAIPAGMTSFNLALYNVTPPSAIADNGAWDIPAGDRNAFLGLLSLGTPADLGSTLYVETSNIWRQLRLAGTHLFGYLVTVGGFTPAANSEVYRVGLHAQGI